METKIYEIVDLFAQLGLEDNPNAINQSQSNYHGKDKHLLEEAEFWTQAQTHFITEALSSNADCTQAIDRLKRNLK
ncbi:DUF2789 family protein [Catenovulum sp. SM1970]|uniref:DUF2789 family protein n=1 Tax=Marinifaba aquimaris TaxID=2741323 RepID=UPI001574B75F|nr:DUF2789 family protein [Marinifaba aquimaris]NTS77692.1 DUF2789 family protein [Marinifaba aquimaris]